MSQKLFASDLNTGRHITVSSPQSFPAAAPAAAAAAADTTSLSFQTSSSSTFRPSSELRKPVVVMGSSSYSATTMSASKRSRPTATGTPLSNGTAVSPTTTKIRKLHRLLSDAQSKMEDLDAEYVGWILDASLDHDKLADAIDDLLRDLGERPTEHPAYKPLELAQRIVYQLSAEVDEKELPPNVTTTNTKGTAATMVTTTPSRKNNKVSTTRLTSRKATPSRDKKKEEIQADQVFSRVIYDLGSSIKVKGITANAVWNKNLDFLQEALGGDVQPKVPRCFRSMFEKARSDALNLDLMAAVGITDPEEWKDLQHSVWERVVFEPYQQGTGILPLWSTKPGDIYIHPSYTELQQYFTKFKFGIKYAMKKRAKKREEGRQSVEQSQSQDDVRHQDAVSTPHVPPQTGRPKMLDKEVQLKLLQAVENTATASYMARTNALNNTHEHQNRALQSTFQEQRLLDERWTTTLQAMASQFSESPQVKQQPLVVAFDGCVDDESTLDEEASSPCRNVFGGDDNDKFHSARSKLSQPSVSNTNVGNTNVVRPLGSPRPLGHGKFRVYFRESDIASGGMVRSSYKGQELHASISQGKRVHQDETLAALVPGVAVLDFDFPDLVEEATNRCPTLTRTPNARSFPVNQQRPPLARSHSVKTKSILRATDGASGGRKASVMFDQSSVGPGPTLETVPSDDADDDVAGDDNSDDRDAYRFKLQPLFENLDLEHVEVGAVLLGEGGQRTLNCCLYLSMAACVLQNDIHRNQSELHGKATFLKKTLEEAAKKYAPAREIKRLQSEKQFGDGTVEVDICQYAMASDSHMQKVAIVVFQKEDGSCSFLTKGPLHDEQTEADRATNTILLLHTKKGVGHFQPLLTVHGGERLAFEDILKNVSVFTEARGGDVSTILATVATAALYDDTDGTDVLSNNTDDDVEDDTDECPTTISAAVSKRSGFGGLFGNGAAVKDKDSSGAFGTFGAFRNTRGGPQETPATLDPSFMEDTEKSGSQYKASMFCDVDEIDKDDPDAAESASNKKRSLPAGRRWIGNDAAGLQGTPQQRAPRPAATAAAFVPTTEATTTVNPFAGTVKLSDKLMPGFDSDANGIMIRVDDDQPHYATSVLGPTHSATALFGFSEDTPTRFEFNTVEEVPEEKATEPHELIGDKIKKPPVLHPVVLSLADGSHKSKDCEGDVEHEEDKENDPPAMSAPLRPSTRKSKVTRKSKATPKSNPTGKSQPTRKSSRLLKLQEEKIKSQEDATVDS